MTTLTNSTDAILAIFSEIASVPRQSRHEQQILQWLINWARQHSLDWRQDAIGNIVIQIPATSGWEQKSPVALQSHVDMVCERAAGISHDFGRDGIRAVRDGDWLVARGTTLGADNGIGMAFALYAATDPELAHPPMELLFTVDEETGLNGATNLDPSLLTSRALINLDSEDEGIFTIGCAGGHNVEIELPMRQMDIPEGWMSLAIAARGFRGGHSGIEIQEMRGNAIYALVRLLLSLLRKTEEAGDPPPRLIDLASGSAHNVIPREAIAHIAILKTLHDTVKGAAAKLGDDLRREYSHTDAAIEIAVDVDRRETASRRCYTDETGARALRLLYSMPDGVYRWFPHNLFQVETSSNMAIVNCRPELISALISLRSASGSALDSYQQKISALAQLAGARCRVSMQYAAWQPDYHSDITRRAKECYRRLFDRDPTIEITHAGLEAGAIGSKYPDMQAISIGPTIQNAHSPDERLLIPTIEPVYRLLASIIGSF